MVRTPRSELIDSPPWCPSFFLQSFPLLLSLVSLWNLQLLTNIDTPVNTFNKSAGICSCVSHSIFMPVGLFLCSPVSQSARLCHYLSVCVFPFICFYLCSETEAGFPPVLFCVCLIICLFVSCLSLCLTLVYLHVTLLLRKTGSLSPCTLLCNLLFVTASIPACLFSAGVSVCHFYL